MNCHWCPEKAAVMILSVSGSINLCRCCSEDWWAIQLQPPSDEFWSIERDTSNRADAEQAGDQGTEFGTRVTAADSRALPVRV